MIYNKVVTIVLLVYLNLFLSAGVHCIITDVSLGDVVEVLDVFLSPTAHELRSSADLVVLSFCHRSNTEINLRSFFRCSSSCIHGFGMICLPWIMFTFLPSCRDFCGTKIWSFQCCKSCSDSVHRTLIGSKPDAALTHIQTFWFMLQTR